MIRRLAALVALPALVAVTWFTGIATPSPALAASATIAVTPATQSVAPGATFTITLTQRADGPTTGAQATIDFDPAVLQLMDAQPGPDYASGTLLIGAVPGGSTGQDEGTPQTVAEALAEANSTGRLKRAATFIAPGGGSAPAGDIAFLTITAQAVVAGTSPITLSDLEMLDDQYNSLVVSGSGGGVTVGGAAVAPAGTPGGGATPGAATPGGTTAGTPAAATTPGAAKTSTSDVLAKSTGATLKSAAFSISPATLKVAKEATFSFAVKAQLDGTASSAQATLSFKKGLMQITKLEPGAGWKADSKALQKAMDDANGTGELQLTLNADSDQPPSGETTLVTATLQGLPGKEGTSPIKFGTTDITGGGASSVPVTLADGEIVVGNGGGSSMMLIVLVVVVGLAVAAAGGGYAYMRKKGA